MKLKNRPIPMRLPMNLFDKRLARLRARQEELLTRPNSVADDWDNGIYER